MTTSVHQEPFVHLVDVSHERALIAWGAFFFTRASEDRARWRIVDDQELHELVGRRTCIGHSAEPFGPAEVEVRDRAGKVVAKAATDDRSWAWVEGLQPDTEYHYRIVVGGEEWAQGERWDWVPSDRGGYDLARAGRSYDLRFRTWPEPDAPTPRVRFAAVGDYGVGIRSDSESSRRQRRVAEVLDHLVEAHDVRFVMSLGDNIYQGEQGQVDDESGGEDDDWYSSFFQPYRYAIARVPVFPAIGNHDTTETEGSDDRAQMEDNFHLGERFANQPSRSTTGPGLFYRLRYGLDLQLVCIDTSVDSDGSPTHRYFQAHDQQRWLRAAFDGTARWTIPFSHHPMYCAGPSHPNDDEMREALQPLYDRAGVRLVLAGHEHNFQVSEVDGCTHVVSGAGGQLREDVPEQFAEAFTTAWAAQAHLILVDIDADQAMVTPISGMLPGGTPQLMTAMTSANKLVEPPFVIRVDEEG